MGYIPANGELPQSGSLTSRWLLNEASGTRADSVGSNTLADTTTVPSGTGYTNLVSGADFTTAAHFQDSGNERLQITDGSQSGLDFTTAFTLAFLFKADSTFADYRPFFQKWDQDTTQAAYDALVNGNNLILNVSPDGTSGASKTLTATGGMPDTTTWHHYVFVYEASTRLQIYRDGSSLGTNTTSIPSSLKNSSRAFEVGGSSLSTITLDGYMQDLVAWNVPLSTTEVANLYRVYTTSKGGAILLALMG